MEEAFIPDEENFRKLKVVLNDKEEETKMEFLNKLNVVIKIGMFIKDIVDKTDINMAFSLYDRFE